MNDRLEIPWAAGAPSTGPARRLFLSPLGVALLGGLLLVVLMKLADWTAELLWFRALSYEDVFWRLLFAKVAMFVIAFIPVFLYILLNFLVLVRLAGVPQPNVRRLNFLLILGSIATAAVFGFAFSGEWDLYLRLVWAQDFGTSDPIYFRDIGFYLFVLPFLNFVQTSLVLLTLSGTLMLGLAYFRIGGLQFDAKRYVTVDPKVLRQHIANAVLLLIALAFGYYLDRFGLLTRSAGAVFGAGYTDVHVLLVGLWVAMGATVTLICLLMWVAATNTPRFAVFGIGFYLVILLLALEVVPAGFQRLIVEPNELALETPFLRHNIALTRAAYDLDDIDVRFHSTETKLDVAQLQANQSTIDNIRIWDHRPLSQTFRQLQQIRTYYEFSDVDVDRYWINGDYRQVMLAARELSADLPSKGNSWVNRHLQYTHGYGLAMCLAAEKDDQGGPSSSSRTCRPRVRRI